MPEQIIHYQFDGQKGQFDVGWQQASWYDLKNIQIPIDHEDGKPTHWIYWEAEGQSYYADDKDWNRFKSPEQRFMWAKFLPENEHATLLNDLGQSYNWFHSNSPFHSRLARPAFLRKGKVELTFEFFADWYKWEKRKVPLNEVGDPNNCRAELWIVDTGLDEQLNWDTADEGSIRRNHAVLQGHLNQLAGQHDEWLIVNPTIGHTVKRKTFDVPRDGIYLLVYGIMTVWAVPGGRGRNGLFVLAMDGRQVEGEAATTPVITPEPETEPVKAAHRGQPRLQYERIYQLIHSSVPDDLASQIFLDGRHHGKTTGTSADDAGLGDLDVKIVEVYGWPAAEHGELEAFFAQHYPGTVVRFLGIG